MPTDQSAPKAFISHASEDKERFVISFATALRANGIDAWVDQWEIKAGDSLVQKIFEEGIGSATVVIVILSKISVAKRWVREELDSAVVARIQKGSKLIPVVIDDCDIPTSLQHIAHIRVADLGDVEKVSNQIARSLFDAQLRPPLGPPPGYARSDLALHMPGLQRSDEQVLLALGDISLEQGGDYIDRDMLLSRVGVLGVSEGLLVESLEMLESEHLVEGLHGVGGKFLMVRWRHRGAAAVIKARYSNYSELERRVAIYVVNNCDAGNNDIASGLNIPTVVVDHFLEGFRSRGLIQLVGSIGGFTQIVEISPKLKRAVSG